MIELEKIEIVATYNEKPFSIQIVIPNLEKYNEEVVTDMKEMYGIDVYKLRDGFRRFIKETNKEK